MTETTTFGRVRHRLSIFDLFTVQDGELCRGETNVLLLDKGEEVETIVFSGKVGPGPYGYYRSVYGPQGMTADILSGPGRIELHQLDEESTHG